MRRFSVRIGPLLTAAGLAVLALLMPESAQAQCAMCRTALDSPEGRKLIAAFQSGTFLLLAVPLAAFATVAWLAVRGHRRLQQPQEMTSPQEE